MTYIDETARIDPTAQIGENVRIGPHCIVGAGADIGDDCELVANVFIAAGVKIGKENRFFQSCVIGEEPQFYGKRELEGTVVIGDHNDFREMVTINRGSPHDSGQTVVGSNNYLMIGVHLGHGCTVGNNNCIGNYSQFSGHCKLEDNIWTSAYCAAHQFVTIGRFVYAAGSSAMSSDVPPYVKISGGYPCEVRGLNSVGLERAGIPSESIAALQQAYKKLYRRREGSIMQVVEKMLAENGHDDHVVYLLESLQRSFQHRLGRYLEQFR